MRIYHAGPGGARSDDGTLELLEKWRIPVEFGSIDEGFGAVRTKAIRSSPCDWVMLLDADERFFPVHRVLTCAGESTPQSEVDWILQSYDFRGVNLPNWENMAKLGARLRVDIGVAYDQGARLREIIAGGGDFDAIATIRRHWHDFSFRRPTQNWHTDLDWQMRLVRNDPAVGFDSGTRMHERLLGRSCRYCGVQRLSMPSNHCESSHTGSHDWSPKSFCADMTRGPFFDHFHFTFKRMEPDQRAHDVMIYDAIHAGKPAPTREEFKK